MSDVLPDTMRTPAIVDRLLLSVSVISAVAYLVSQTEPFAGSAVVKSLAVSPLALISIRRLRDRSGLLLGAALFLSAVGDLLLGIDPDRLFVYGLAAFLIAHVLYIALFAFSKSHSAAARSTGEPVGTVLLPEYRMWRPLVSRPVTSEPISSQSSGTILQERGSRPVHLLVAVLIAGYVASMMIWLWPSLGDLRIPVLAYICVITCMGVMSLLAGFRSWIVPAGALLFMVSDSLIAISKFKYPIMYGNYLIWCTYYAGQFCIAMGFLQHRGRSRYSER